MVSKVSVVLTDDIDGSEADETITFGIDGHTYEIDLSSKNAASLRKALEKYTAAARKVGRSSSAPKGRRGTAKRDPEQTKAIRDWANANGHSVGDRGRIPATVEEAYAAAHTA